ncbi:MAG: methyltransferase domain-containing protein [Desulfuromonadaceae bacterium]|nr:methyltransferase domain-containing protein [Desulfuromonadaceae bacterium]MDD2849530.1 methyltransferase domain-containing protein [Desulfuromonadaceae bacterium]MDD4131956.1 methyltransferase domain-containing protein [Desulfuromonadaceae bacterium]
MTIRRLHIGALHSTPGWESLNAQPLAGIDHVCDAGNLTCFADGTFAELYASHVLEHFDYRDEFAMVLAEWFRVLAPGGRLFVSVPDMDIICRMYCDRVRFDSNDRYMLMRMILGGHSDQYDYHHAAYNEELLVHYLSAAGFNKITRQEEFGLFDDTSAMRFHGELISLNLTAEKH